MSEVEEVVEKVLEREARTTNRYLKIILFIMSMHLAATGTLAVIMYSMFNDVFKNVADIDKQVVLNVKEIEHQDADCMKRIIDIQRQIDELKSLHMMDRGYDR